MQGIHNKKFHVIYTPMKLCKLIININLYIIYCYQYPKMHNMYRMIDTIQIKNNMYLKMYQNQYNTIYVLYDEIFIIDID